MANGDLGEINERAFEIVAIAASAGGVQALGRLLSALPADLDAAVVIVQHVDPRHRSLLPDILERRSVLKVQPAHAADHIQSGTVYVASPNRHLLVEPDRTFSLSEAELVHFVRPSADLLFESVATCYGDRAIAVVLTGTGSDGATGVVAIKEKGGTVIAQDPVDAEFAGMPTAAMETGCVDYPLSLDEIAGAVTALTTGDQPG